MSEKMSEKMSEMIGKPGKYLRKECSRNREWQMQRPWGGNVAWSRVSGRRTVGGEARDVIGQILGH